MKKGTKVVKSSELLNMGLEPIQVHIIDNRDIHYRWWEGESGKMKLDLIRVGLMRGYNEKESCVVAGVTQRQLYYYINNINPSFQEEKEELKYHLSIKAREVMAKAIGSDPDYALKHLIKTYPEEFKGLDPTSRRMLLTLVDTPIIDDSYNQLREGETS